MDHNREKELRERADAIITEIYGKITKEHFEQFLATEGDNKNG